MIARINYVLILTLTLTFAARAQEGGVFNRQAMKDRMLKVAEWQLVHPNHELYEWTNGAFYAGLFAAYETTRSPALMNAMMDMGEKNQWKPGPRFDHADDITIGQTYIDLYRIKRDRKMIEPLITTVDRL